MEVSPSNPNEALTALYVGDKIVFVPVIEYYMYRDHPEEALAHFALEHTVELQSDEEET